MGYMKKHIVLINGSGTPNSHTGALLRHIANLLQKRGVRTSIWNIQEKPLPPVDPELYGNPNHSNVRVKEFIQLVDSADGIVLGTPLYHGSFSGLLKNSLDNLGSDAFKNKHIGLVSNVGGAGNMQACEHLRSVVRSLYGYALQTQIVTTEEDYIDSKDNKKVKSLSIQQRCIRLADELIFFANLMQNNTALS